MLALATVLMLTAPAHADTCGAPKICSEDVPVLQTALTRARPPASDDDQDGTAKGSSWADAFKGFGGKVRDTVSGIKNSFAPTAEERAAIEFVHSMLEPDKLGGDDRTFNQNDIPRIVDALLLDTSVRNQIASGIRQEAFRQANDMGLFSGIARRIANKRTTPGTRAYCKHYGEYWAQGVATARARITNELTTALQGEGIQPKRGQGLSGVERTLTLSELEQFQASVELLQQYGERVESKLGKQGDVGHGLSQALTSKILTMFPAK